MQNDQNRGVTSALYGMTLLLSIALSIWTGHFVLNGTGRIMQAGFALSLIATLLSCFFLTESVDPEQPYTLRRRYKQKLNEELSREEIHQELLFLSPKFRSLIGRLRSKEEEKEYQEITRRINFLKSLLDS